MTAGGWHGTEGRAVSEDSISDELRAVLNEMRSAGSARGYHLDAWAKAIEDALLAGGGPVEPPDDAPPHKWQVGDEIAVRFRLTQLDESDDYQAGWWFTNDDMRTYRRDFAWFEDNALHLAGRAAGSDARATSPTLASVRCARCSFPPDEHIQGRKGCDVFAARGGYVAPTHDARATSEPADTPEAT